MEKMIHDNLRLPQGWKWVKLSELVDNPKQDLVDGPFGSNLKAEEYKEEGVPVFKIQNIKVNKFVDKKISYITEEKAKTLARHSFKGGDLIITKLGEPLGLCCKVPPKYPFGIIVADLMRLRPSKTKVYDQYLIYAINSEIVQNQFKTITKGTTRARVNLGIVRDIQVAIPSLAEQHAIVSKIEELLSELDKGKQQLETAQQQLKVYRQAVLKWAFEGKLTNNNVQEGELPKEWQLVKLGKLMESVRNGYSKKPDEFGKYKILRISSVRPNRVNIDEVRFLEKEISTENSLEENDLLFTRYNGSIDFVGVCGRVPKLNESLFYPDKLIRCRPVIKEWFHSAYIDYAANSRLARQFVLSKIKTTAGQTGISGSDVKEIPIPLSSLNEQKLIVQEIESRLSVCDKVEETIKQSLAQAETLRQSILKKAFEGKLI